MATPRELCLAIESIAEVLTTDNCLHVFRAILDGLNTEAIMRVSRRTRDIGAIRLVQRALDERNAVNQEALLHRLGEWLEKYKIIWWLILYFSMLYW